MSSAVDMLVRVIEAGGVVLIFAGIRRDLGGSVVLGLDFLLAAAVLDASIDLTADSFARLLAVAGIRVALSLLILGELRSTATEGGPAAAGADPAAGTEIDLREPSRAAPAADPPEPVRAEDLREARARLGIVSTSTPGRRAQRP